MSRNTLIHQTLPNSADIDMWLNVMNSIVNFVLASTSLLESLEASSEELAAQIILKHEREIGSKTPPQGNDLPALQLTDFPYFMGVLSQDVLPVKEELSLTRIPSTKIFREDNIFSDDNTKQHVLASQPFQLLGSTASFTPVCVDTPKLNLKSLDDDSVLSSSTSSQSINSDLFSEARDERINPVFSMISLEDNDNGDGEYPLDNLDNPTTNQNMDSFYEYLTEERLRRMNENMERKTEEMQTQNTRRYKRTIKASLINSQELTEAIKRLEEEANLLVNNQKDEKELNLATTNSRNSAVANNLKSDDDQEVSENQKKEEKSLCEFKPNTKKLKEATTHQKEEVICNKNEEMERKSLDGVKRDTKSDIKKIEKNEAKPKIVNKDELMTEIINLTKQNVNNVIKMEPITNQKPTKKQKVSISLDNKGADHSQEKSNKNLIEEKHTENTNNKTNLGIEVIMQNKNTNKKNPITTKQQNEVKKEVTKKDTKRSPAHKENLNINSNNIAPCSKSRRPEIENVIRKSINLLSKLTPHGVFGKNESPSPPKKSVRKSSLEVSNNAPKINPRKKTHIGQNQGTTPKSNLIVNNSPPKVNASKLKPKLIQKQSLILKKNKSFDQNQGKTTIRKNLNMQKNAMKVEKMKKVLGVGNKTSNLNGILKPQSSRDVNDEKLMVFKSLKKRA